MHPAERWLKDANISHISEDEIKYIESSTTGQSKKISHNKRTFNFKDSFTIYDSIWGCPNKWVTFTDKNATLSGSTTMFRLVLGKCNGFILKEEDGHIFLDNNHDYFYQVQRQLFCTGATSCNFVIYTFKDFKCIHVKRDDIFINNMVKKLQEFYEQGQFHHL
jgi:hypothetical protein